MAINRYVDVNFDQPVSSHVPLPLEMMYKLGKDASKDYEDTMKGIDDGKGLLSKHKTQAATKIYSSKSDNGIEDANIDFEPVRQGYTKYINQQKESIVGDYIKDKDTSKYKQRMSRLKGEVSMMDNDLAVKSESISQILKFNEELSKNEAFGKNTALGTKMLDYNTDYINKINAGKNPGSYNPYAVAKEIKVEDVLKTDADNWSESDAGSAAYSDGQYIHDISAKGITGTRVYDFASQNWENPNHSMRASADLEVNHYLKTHNYKYDDIREYHDYKKDAKGNIIKDSKGAPVIETKQGKIGDILLEDKKQEYARSLAARLVHTNYNPSLKVDSYGLSDYNRKKEAEVASGEFSQLPVFEGNVDPQPVTRKGALEAVGISGDNLNLDGSVDTGDIKNFSDAQKQDNIDTSRKLIENYKKDPASYTQQMLVYGKSLLQSQKLLENDDLKKRYSDKYKNLLVAGYRFNLLKDNTNADGSINYFKLETDLASIGEKLSTTSSNSMGLQDNFADNLTKKFFGTTTGSGDKAVFSKSPMFEKMNIYKQNDPNSASELRDGGKNALLAQNAKFVGIDFNDPNNGALTFTATEGKGDVEPKLYTGITPDVNFKSSMAPVHNFTSLLNKSINNTLSQEDKNNGASTATNIFTRLKNGILKDTKVPLSVRQTEVEKLNAIFSEIYSSRNGVVVGEATLDEKNNSKYTLVGSPIIDGSQNITKKVLKIDKSNGSYEYVNLGDIQYSESAHIQKKHAGGYDKTAKGYDSKKETYIPFEPQEEN